MPAPLPVPIEFDLPEGWLPARPDGPDPDAMAEEETLEGLAQESVRRLAESAGPVEVVQRREVGSDDAPALIQRLAFQAVADGVRRDLIQSQVYLDMADVADPRRRAVVRPALTATAEQHDEVLGDFQDFVSSVRPDTGAEA